MNLLDCLLDHDYWATTTLLGVCRDLTDAQLDQEFDIGHRTLRATFDHMIFNIDAWAAPMVEQPIDARRDQRSIPELIERHDRAYARFAGVARQVRDEQRWDDTYIAHFGAPMRFGATALHVVLHNEGHRTEVLHILQRLGVPDLPEVDHGLWDLDVRGL